MATQVMTVESDSWIDVSNNLSLKNGDKYILENRDGAGSIKLHVGANAPSDSTSAFTFLHPSNRIGYEQVSGESIYAMSVSNDVALAVNLSS